MKDFSFVRELAAKQPNFTIPPTYVLWLLMKIKGDICLVAEEKKSGPVAYLLAVPIEEQENSLYVWQLASAAIGDNDNAVLPILWKLHEITEQTKVRSMFFSAFPKSAEFRRIKRYIRTVWAAKPQATRVLADIVAPGETEYRIDLR